MHVDQSTSIWNWDAPGRAMSLLDVLIACMLRSRLIILCVF